VIIHQSYELWFKQVLHEAALLQRPLENGDSAGSLATARRMAKILKTVVGQFDILETMTPRQFARFRPELGSSSGFQSSQFRYIEAVLGRRDFPAAVIDQTLDAITGRRPLFASLLRYLNAAGFQVPADILHQDPRPGWVPPSTAHKPYHADEYEPLWACAEANGLPIFFHLAAGGANTKTGNSITGDAVKGILTAMAMGKDKELTNATLAARTMGGGNSSGAVPMRIISELIASGACDRHPNLLWNTIEYNAGWLAHFMSMMDKGWRTGTGQDSEWWMGFLQEGKPWDEQDLFGQLFLINERWPYDLKPSEYVKRNIRVQFADDRMAVQARHITGVDTIYWGNDYPHAEGTFLGSQAVISEQMFDVPEPDRAKMLGGTLAKIVGFDTAKKFAPVTPSSQPASV
jgi:predicted TIM-barrel fold metal-dependent hydrolase